MVGAMISQPDGTLAAKLKHCTEVGCPFLCKDAVCGYRKAQSGPNKGKFLSIADWDVCPKLMQREKGEV